MTAAQYPDCGARDEGAFKRTNNSTDHDFDAEVARFLETEFFASKGDDGAEISSFQRSSDKQLSVLTMDEDLVLMNLIASIDIPDLDFKHVGEPPSEDVRMSDDHAVSSSLQLPSLAATYDLQPTSSLYVLIPACALKTPPPANKPTVRRRRRSVKKTAPRRPKVKKERKRVKDEIEYLRQQVKALGKKLEELQHGSSETANSDCSSLDVSEGQATETRSQSQVIDWESIAKSQKFKQQKSRVENLQLRQRVNNQLGLARVLSKALQELEDLSESTQTRQLCSHAS